MIKNLIGVLGIAFSILLVGSVAPAKAGFVEIGGLPSLSGITAGLGGSTLLVGSCVNNTTTVSGATTSMAVIVTPTTYPGTGVTWYGYVSAPNVVTVSVCGVVAVTPTNTTYNIRVVQ